MKNKTPIIVLWAVTFRGFDGKRFVNWLDDTYETRALARKRAKTLKRDITRDGRPNIAKTVKVTKLEGF